MSLSKAWGCEKYLTNRQSKLITRKVSKYLDEDKKTEFRINKKVISHDKITRHLSNTGESGQVGGVLRSAYLEENTLSLALLNHLGLPDSNSGINMPVRGFVRPF